MVSLLLLLVNSHEESDTLMRCYLVLVDLENKVICVKSNYTDAFTAMFGNFEELNGLTLPIACSNEKWVNLPNAYAQLGTEEAKALIDFHCFSGCNSVEEFTGKTKGT